MTLVQFLLDRCDEALAGAGCRYERVPAGSVRCLCEAPAPHVLELMAQRDLIRRWAHTPDGRVLLQLLADEHAHHPDYRAEWHPVAG